MFGFGPSKKKVERKISEVGKKMDPNNAPSSISASGAASMGVTSMVYDSTVRDYNSSKQSSRDRKAVYKSMKEIERDTKKAMKK